MKKIVVIGNTLFSLRNFRGPLLLELKTRAELVCVAPNRNPHIEEWIRSHGMRFEHVPFARSGKNPFADLLLTLRFIKLFLREKPSHVLCYTLKPALFGTFAARLTRVPSISVLLSGLGFLFTENRARSIVSRVTAWGLKLQMRSVESVIFQNQDDKDEFEKLGIIDSSTPVHVVSGSGVPLDAFPLRELPLGPPVFLMVSRFLKDKGFIEFCEAAGRVRDSGKAARFAILGAPDRDNPAGLSTAECDSLLQTNGVENWGWHEDVREYLARSHVFVLPSYREGTPRSALEAMSMGRALVVSDVPGCREVVRDGVTGFLCHVRDSASLATQISRFIDEPSLISKMGQESRRYAEERFDVRKVNASMIEALKI